MKKEIAKMIAGELYDPRDEELRNIRLQSRKFSKIFNACDPENSESKKKILSKWLGHIGSNVEIEAPFICDYGIHLFIGDRVFINFNCIILDSAKVEIGNDCMFGPNVQIYTATHPLDADKRVQGPEYALPVTLGERVWIGGGAILCPGVLIGNNTTIGAGSVVTKSIPPNVFAAGNPCSVIRQL